MAKYPVFAIENNNCLLWLNYGRPNEPVLLWWLRPSDGYIADNNFVYLDSPIDKSYGWTSGGQKIMSDYMEQGYKPRNFNTNEVIDTPLKEYLKGVWKAVL